MKQKLSIKALSSFPVILLFCISPALYAQPASFSQSQAGSASLKQMEWIKGDWNRTNARPGTKGTESWSKHANELTGTGITLRGSDTAVLEKLKIVQKGNDFFYVADLKENNGPVYFKMTRITDDEFVCENPEHDFPKMIIYRKDGNNLKATISGNGKSVDYLFERKK